MIELIDVHKRFLVNVNVSVPHGVFVTSPGLKLGGNFAPFGNTAAKVTVFFVLS